MTNEYNHMFAISEVKRHFYDAESGITTKNSGRLYSATYKYDLPNENVYTLNGELFQEAGQVSNNTSYLLYFIHAHILDIKPFLNYQFSKTPHKESFLDYTQYGISSAKQISENKKALIIDWINEQRLEEKKTILPTGEATLYTNLNDVQIKTLHNLLIADKYIRDISEVDFDYWLSNKPLRGIPKIKWIKSKGMAIYLFKKICIDYKLSSLNKCVESKNKSFDSNDASKSGYHEIDQILIQVKK